MTMTNETRDANYLVPHMVCGHSLETSASLIEITKALAGLWVCGEELRRNKAIADRTNPRFKSSYTSLASLQRTVLPALAGYQVAVIQTQTVEPTPAGGVIVVVQTLVTHPSGEYLLARSASAPLDRTDIQSQGSICTYLRRYALASLFAIEIDPESDATDDDGNAVSPPPKKKGKAAPPRTAAKAAPPPFDATVPYIVELVTPNDTGTGTVVLQQYNQRATRTVTDVQVWTTIANAKEHNLPVYATHDPAAGVTQASTEGPPVTLTLEDIPF
jgi:hypothetical protein